MAAYGCGYFRNWTYRDTYAAQKGAWNIERVRFGGIDMIIIPEDEQTRFNIIQAGFYNVFQKDM